jgi:hypothetical protein
MVLSRPSSVILHGGGGARPSCFVDVVTRTMDSPPHLSAPSHHVPPRIKLEVARKEGKEGRKEKNGRMET